MRKLRQKVAAQTLNFRMHLWRHRAAVQRQQREAIEAAIRQCSSTVGLGPGPRLCAPGHAAADLPGAAPACAAPVLREPPHQGTEAWLYMCA